MNTYWILFLLTIVLFSESCKKSEDFTVQKETAQVEKELEFKTDYPEGAASFLAKHKDKVIDVEELNSAILAGEYTVDEVKFWITQFDYSDKDEVELINDHNLLACCQFLGKRDPKWMLKFYFEEINQVKMLTVEGSDTVLDDSWLPNKGDWMIVSPNDGFVHSDAVLDNILHGWNRQKNFQMLEWCKLLETNLIENTFVSGVKENAVLLKMKRK